MATAGWTSLSNLGTDDIYYPDPKPPSLNVVGGAGSYSVLGARLFRPAPASKNLGWVVHKGSDFPAEIEEEIDAWETSCDFQNTPWRLTTRGWNEYGADEKRGRTIPHVIPYAQTEPLTKQIVFKYSTEKLRVDETQLSERHIESRCFHLICTPQRCMALVQGILDRRRQLNLELGSPDEPFFIWEPVPDACGPGALAKVLEAMECVDVVSPNHHELAALFTQDDAGDAVGNVASMKEQSRTLFEKGFGTREAAVVVRCGEKGCYMRLKDKEIELPAYHQAPGKVNDPTGAGNAYLGGYAMGMLDSPDPKQRFVNGALYGTVAASFAVEQVGLPKLHRVQGVELWNGDQAQQRLEEFRSRIGGDGWSQGMECAR